MSDHALETPYGDPLSAPFWDAARRHELALQRCLHCGAHQHYPRPFCLTCNSLHLEWVTSPGTGVIYSKTTVHVRVLPDLEPPYDVVLIELDEGPRLLGHVEPAGRIGDRVIVAFRERPGEPPLPVFRPLADTSPPG